MITYVEGKLVEKKPTAITIDVQGIGYSLLITTSTFEVLPAVGTNIKLHTHFHVREESQSLFGFATLDERAVFRILISVSGVGPKLALAALSAMSPNELRSHVVSRNLSILTKIPGVGKKTAERMVVELKDKLEPVELSNTSGTIHGSAPSVRSDAIAALQALGLSRTNAEKNVDKVMSQNSDVSVEQVIRMALRD